MSADLNKMFIGLPAMLNEEDDPLLWKSLIAVLLDDSVFVIRRSKREQNASFISRMFLLVPSAPISMDGGWQIRLAHRLWQSSLTQPNGGADTVLPRIVNGL